MATEAQRNYFRDDLGLDHDETVFTDEAIDDLYTRAAEKHSDDELIEAYARVLGCRQGVAKAATLTDYDQGDSSEKLSQVFKQLAALLKLYEAAYTALLAASSTRPPVRMGALKAVPSRREDYPNG